MTPEVVIDTREQLAVRFVQRFEQAARRAISIRQRFSCALPGGSVAETFFPLLARADVAWEHVHFFWGDERAVPATDPESNYGLAARLWLEPIHADASRVHRMPADASDLDAAAEAHASELVRVLGDPPRLDLVLLGVGPEGHVCSLFPGHAALAERVRRVVAVTDSPKPPPRRLTLTLPTLAVAASIYVVSFGGGKAEAIRAAVEGDNMSMPVALAVRSGPESIVMVDRDAASLLRSAR